MYRRVLHHTYANARASDVSGNGNHGVPTATSPGTGPHASSLWFDGHDSRVDVPPSPDLADLRGLRVRVRFQMRPRPVWWWWRWPWLSRTRWWNRRQKLIEGHLSFALFVQPDRSIRGTIFDANGVWRGPVTPAGVVTPGQWHTVEFGHDGVVSAAIAVDGVTLAVTHDLVGPVRGVGPRGLTIGHWPEPPHVYTLFGWVDDLEVWREEPDPELVDDCCGSPEVVDAAVDELREEGWDHTKAKEVVRRLEGFEADLRIAVTGGDPARAAEVQALAARGSSAIARRDPVEAMSALGGTLQLFAARLTTAQQNAFLARAQDLLAALPLSKRLRDALDGDLGSRAWLSELAAALCLPVPPAGDPRRDPERKPPPVPLRLGDPHTDGPEQGRDGPPGHPYAGIVGWQPTPDDRERGREIRRNRQNRAQKHRQALRPESERNSPRRAEEDGKGDGEPST